MSDQKLRLLAPQLAPPYERPKLPLGRYLVQNGVISSDHLVQALELQKRLGAPIGEILVSEGWADTDDIQAALAQQHGVAQANLCLQPPESQLFGLRPSQFWLHHRMVPWMRLGRAILVATARPDLLDRMRADWGRDCPELLPVLTDEAQITAAIARHYAQPLAAAAGCRVAAEFSCRSMRSRDTRLVILALLVPAAVALIAPFWTIIVLVAASMVTLALFFSLKLVGTVAHLLSHNHLTAPQPPPRSDQPSPARIRTNPQSVEDRLPKVSVLVPLFQETEIAGALIKRLSGLTYPKVLLDVVLVLEEEDILTRATLAATPLPAWMRVIEVPAHDGLTTKPRAMNYALDFCRGDIIGVWDAEDAPANDQIEQVVSHFAQAPDDVACLQGILDYYNPRSNWLSRCFTIEYSSWFRVVLPGIARLGLVVPLGGTTLFIKRDILDQLGGWDAHNVTEDADLGVRLCRAGYRTEMIDTVTFEEANFRAWPWVRQRSRWLKGFMVTYLVHMRHPTRLLADLGPWRFWGVQAFFLGTLGQFLLAPVLWSFWLILLGYTHPVMAVAPPLLVYGFAGLLALTELLALCVGLIAVSRGKRRFLLLWVPTMMLYFPLGTLAAYKALYELLLRPFFWDKTQHGHAAEETA